MEDGTKSKLAFTGERFIPSAGGARIAYEHYHRYFFARRIARGKVVLDLGCGEGYGACLLAGVAEQVTAIDLSQEALDHACSRYVKTNLKYVLGDCRNTQLPERHFDLVVCFEMIEHIAEHDRLLTEVRRVLKSDGVFVVSSPDKEFYSDADAYENPFHIRELYAHEFQTLLEGHFSHVALFSQKVCMGSLLYQTPGNSDALRGEMMESQKSLTGTFETRNESGRGAKYVIGVCSNAPLGEEVRSLSLSVWNDTSETLVRELEQYQRELQGSMEQLTQHLREVEVRVKELEQQVRGLDEALREKSDYVSQLVGEVAQQKARLSIRDQELLVRDQHLKGLQEANATLLAFEQKVKGTLAWKLYRAVVKPLKAVLRSRE